MITVQSAEELQVEGQLPQQIKVMSFGNGHPLWQKYRDNNLINKIQSNEKYEYFKIGKIFGLEITRYIAIVQNKLVYFQEIEAEQFIGHCSLNNLYVQWVPLKTSRFLLIISNGTETSYLYFNTDRFWIDRQRSIERYAVLVDFYQKYTISEGLGQGNFSKIQVYKVKNKQNGNIYAAKITIKDNCNRSIIKMIMQERNNLISVKDNVNLCEFQSFYETNNEYIILMDYIYGKDLMTFIRMKRNLSLEELKLILCNILMGIKECHHHKIIHRDIKPQNIIINIHTFSLKIIDFGLSINLQKQCHAQDFKTCGTVGYMAPEVINCYNTTIYNEKCDIFSFGIIAHLLLMGVNPLKGKCNEQTSIKNKICELKLHQAQIISKYGDNGLFFLKKLLCFEQCIRFSAEQALFSSFLRQNSSKSETTTQQDVI